MRPIPLLAVPLVLLAGCGGGGSGGDGPPSDRTVIDRWATAVREAEFDTAAAQFALPATVFNGPPGEVELSTRSDVDDFNQSFPCGAVLQDTQAEAGGTTLATFKLVRIDAERPCPGAVGAEAKVSFDIDADGHIAKWYRVSLAPPPGSQAA